MTFFVINRTFFVIFILTWYIVIDIINPKGGYTYMKAITLSEMAKINFSIQMATIRLAKYNEGDTYRLSNGVYRKQTGIVYLKNCDMETTSLNTNTQYHFKKGSLVLLPEFSTYYSVFTNIDKSSYSFCSINMIMHDSKFNKLVIEKEPYEIFESSPDSIKNHIEHLSLTNNTQHALLQSQLFMLWHLIFENLDAQNTYKHDIDKAIHYINVSNMSNEELAAKLNISVSTLIRMFKKHYNTTPASFALNSKIKDAEYRLLTTDMSINQLATNLGFNSPEHFSRIFKKHIGMSPVKYRNSNIKK